MKKRSMKKLMILMAVATVVLSGCGKKQQQLSGAGATFPQPFYNMVFRQFAEAGGAQVSYGGIGSGGGVRSLKDGTADFAGSDAFLSDEEMNEMKPTIHVPTCMGAVVLAYNVKGLTNLRLTGDVVADIFLGKITKWNDVRIAAVNPGMKLPDQTINVIYRSDGSGTTFVFTDYLSKISTEWKDKFGAAKSVPFPVGIAAKGNPGVAGVLSSTEYAIGYVGSEYAFAQNLSMAELQNANGDWVKPTTATIAAAATGEMPTDTRVSITNSTAANAYPISLFTWLIVYKEQSYGGRTYEHAKAVSDLLKYMMDPKTQAQTEKVNYAPLPEKVRQQSLENIKSMTFNGQAIK